MGWERKRYREGERRGREMVRQGRRERKGGRDGETG